MKTVVVVAVVTGVAISYGLLERQRNASITDSAERMAIALESISQQYKLQNNLLENLKEKCKNGN